MAQNTTVHVILSLHRSVTAKVELKFSDEDEASRFHYMYVITKPAN